MRRKCPYTARKKKKNHHRQLDLCRFYHLVTEKVLFFGVLLENSMKHADVCAPSRLVRCRCLPQSLRLWAASQERCGRASLRSELRNRSQRWGVGRTDKATLQAVLHRCTEGKKTKQWRAESIYVSGKFQESWIKMLKQDCDHKYRQFHCLEGTTERPHRKSAHKQWLKRMNASPVA